MARKGHPIEINPAHKGKFTDWAKAHGMSVSEAAHKEAHAPGKLGKEARFAEEAESGTFKHAGHHGRVQSAIGHSEKHGGLHHTGLPGK